MKDTLRRLSRALRRLGRFVASSRKAIISGLSTGIAAAIPLLQDGNLSALDALIIVGATLGVGKLTHAVPNDNA